MSAQLIICLVIFVLTLVSFILNKIPLWVTAMASMGLLYLTGCLTSAEALSGFGNSSESPAAAELFLTATSAAADSVFHQKSRGMKYPDSAQPVRLKWLISTAQGI